MEQEQKVEEEEAPGGGLMERDDVMKLVEAMKLALGATEFFVTVCAVIVSIDTYIPMISVITWGFCFIPPSNIKKWVGRAASYVIFLAVWYMEDNPPTKLALCGMFGFSVACFLVQLLLLLFSALHGGNCDRHHSDQEDDHDDQYVPDGRSELEAQVQALTEENHRLAAKLAFQIALAQFYKEQLHNA